MSMNNNSLPLTAFEEGLADYMRDELSAISELMSSEYEPEPYNEADAFDYWDQYLMAMDEDIESDIDSYPQTRRGRQERRKQTFKHEARRRDIAQNYGFVRGLWLNDYEQPKYLRRKRKSTREGFYKHVSNKRWRKTANEHITNKPSEYRKVFDYGWEID